LEKRRYLEMGDKASPVQEIPFEIRIDCDVKNRKLVFTDTGLCVYKYFKIIFYLKELE